MATTTTIVGISNRYFALAQFETVTVMVSNAAGLPVNGPMSIQVNGEMVSAQVVNGFAVATVETPMLNFALLFNLFFPHPLSAAFGGTDAFGPSGASTMVPGILVDFFFQQLALLQRQLTQFQTM